MKHLTSILHRNRHFLYCLLATVLLLSCGTKERTQEAIKWITKAPKPIKVYNHAMNGWNYERDYTLVDSLGVIFYTGEVYLTLPDTIR